MGDGERGRSDRGFPSSSPPASAPDFCKSRETGFCFLVCFSGRQVSGFQTLSGLDSPPPWQSRRFAPAYRFSLGPCRAAGAQRAAEPGYHLGWELGREYSQQKVGWSREYTGWGSLGDLPRHLVGVSKRWGHLPRDGVFGMRGIEATGQTVSSPFPQTPIVHGSDLSCYFLLF